MVAETGDILYNLAGGTELLIALILISRYIYLEPVFDTRRKWVFFWGVYLLGQTALFLAVGTDGDLAVFWPLAAFGGYTAAVRDRHRIRGFFLFFPVTGFLIAPVSLLFGIPYVLTGVRVRDMGKWELLFDLLFWVLLPLILWESREARRRFRAETSYRRLSRWERNLLHGTGLFLLAIGAMIAGGEVLPVSGEAARGFTLLASVAAVLLEVSVTALVQQGNRRSYYQYMADLNRSYLRAELEHFEARRESDTKLRMFRHDIRNHLLCIRELAARGNYSGLSDYIGELEGRLELTDTSLHCGNDIGDAILNEKNMLAARRGIEIRLDGRLPSPLPVDAADICALFANALDNALEAQPGGGWVQVRIRQQGQMLSLVFENPAGNARADTPRGYTEKKDRDSHGFGLLNMEWAARKYQGSLRRDILEPAPNDLESAADDGQGERIYRLAILLHLPSES